MPLGNRLRALLGPLEMPVSLASRASFFDTARFVAAVRSACPARRILEIGCGVGHVSEVLASAYPGAFLLGIDVRGEPGRLFRGDRARAAFLRQDAAALAREQPRAFDLVVFCDVMHHVPPGERGALLADGFAALAAGGTLVLKDWEPSRTPIHWLGYLSDRWVTGDRVVFWRVAEYRRLIAAAWPAARIEGELRIPPWRNNFALLARDATAPAAGAARAGGQRE